MSNNTETLNLSKKKEIGLVIKILSVALIPLIIIVAIAGFALENLADKMSNSLSEHELAATAYSLASSLDFEDTGNYKSDGDVLYKGETNISSQDDIFDDFCKNMDIDATIIVGKTRNVTTIKDDDGKRIVGTDISDKAYDETLKNGSFFTKKIVINGIDYKGYYRLVDSSTPGKEIIIFTGIKTSIAKGIYSSFLLYSIIFMIVITIIGAILIFFFVLTLTKSIESAVKNLDKIADGELNFSISKKLTSRSDEIGNIARAIHSLIVKLAQMVTGIHNSANSLGEFTGQFQSNFETINNSIANVNIAVEEIANGATNQANETQNVNTQINDMGDALDETSKNISTLTASTEQMKQQNVQVNRTIEELISISERTKYSIDEVHKQTNLTNKSAEEIGSAVDIITDIASQTNLLSLNASIEAARAGEHGRGFAVVAEEIRQLADQSSESAERISQIVTNLVHNSNESVKTMENVLSDISSQSDKLSQTQQVVGSLNEEVNNVVVAIENISDQIESIDTVKNEVLGSVESLAAISEENAASTQETSAAMFELSQVVNECNENTKNLVSISNELTDNANKFSL